MRLISFSLRKSVETWALLFQGNRGFAFFCFAVIMSPMNNIEAEIAALSEKIVEKRRELEASRGVVEERELVKSVVGEKISAVQKSAPPVFSIQPGSSSLQHPVDTGVKFPPPAGVSYLDYLDEESRVEVGRLVESVFVNGLEKTLKTLEWEEPFIIDAFHDVLTDRLHGELKKRGLLK